MEISLVKIVKKHEQDFTIIQNTIFKFNDKLPSNKKLSFKAMGIFFYLWHLPHDWEFHESEITNHASDGIDKFRKGREELEKYGFVTKVRRRNKKGQVGQYEWMLDDDPEFKNEFLEKPGLDFPRQGNPKQEKPTQDNPTLQSTYGTKDLNNKVLSDDEEEALKNYKSAFENPNKPISNFMLEKIIKLIQSVHPDVFEYAIDLAATGNAKSPYNFIKKLLDDWNKHKLSTLEQVKSYTDSFKQSKSRNGSSGRKPKREHLPEWATQTPEERKSENKRKQEEHDYKMQHDPEYRKKQEKTDKDLEDNLRRIRELRKEKNYE